MCRLRVRSIIIATVIDTVVGMVPTVGDFTEKQFLVNVVHVHLNLVCFDVLLSVPDTVEGLLMVGLVESDVTQVENKRILSLCIDCFAIFE